MSPDIAKCPLGGKNHLLVLLLYQKKIFSHIHFRNEKIEARNGQEAGSMPKSWVSGPDRKPAVGAAPNFFVCSHTELECVGTYT